MTEDDVIVFARRAIAHAGPGLTERRIFPHERMVRAGAGGRSLILSISTIGASSVLTITLNGDREVTDFRHHLRLTASS